ncbi:hypothetical protein [Prosthecobacter vanneervenii]|uniref:Phospholipase C/D domain-containing protein n=1 Tax=Prosthecobacter vanneervenii TaxID=48466 RepID=A0A7W7YD38_9BACT|nr:hypothetical protein [Prosthecobacter vanneervenii]MBB5033973.1 hypothetical protein [Prosthecobacter vanneervenii]
MSGLIGHTMYGILALKAAKGRGLAVTPLIERHLPSFLCGAYLGCDIQVMPEAVCADTGREVGFGTVPLDKSPITGGAVKPWTLEHDGRKYRPKEIHELFYGRAHLVFGWSKEDMPLRVPWDHLADYCALAIRDEMSSERGLAYALGWMVHMVGDSLIKSIQPGIRMHLLDGVYTPRNRIVQDQFTYHTIGGELGIDWVKTFRDMAATPVETIQPHYMRVDAKRGKLAEVFDAGWKPELQPLLAAVLAENRRWLPHHTEDVLRVVQRDSEEAKRVSGGLEFEAMNEMAESAGMRNTLVIIAEQCADLMEHTIAQVPEWRDLPRQPAQGWDKLKRA